MAKSQVLLADLIPHSADFVYIMAIQDIEILLMVSVPFYKAFQLLFYSQWMLSTRSANLRSTKTFFFFKRVDFFSLEMNVLYWFSDFFW